MEVSTSTSVNYLQLSGGIYKQYNSLEEIPQKFSSYAIPHTYGAAAGEKAGQTVYRVFVSFMQKPVVFTGVRFDTKVINNVTLKNIVFSFSNEEGDYILTAGFGYDSRDLFYRLYFLAKNNIKQLTLESKGKKLYINGADGTKSNPIHSGVMYDNGWVRNPLVQQEFVSIWEAACKYYYLSEIDEQAARASFFIFGGVKDKEFEKIYLAKVDSLIQEQIPILNLMLSENRTTQIALPTPVNALNQPKDFTDEEKKIIMANLTNAITDSKDKALSYKLSIIAQYHNRGVDTTKIEAYMNEAILKAYPVVNIENLDDSGSELSF